MIKDIVHNYGEPCFQDNSTREISIRINDGFIWNVYYKTLYVQGTVDGLGLSEEDCLEQAENALVDAFTYHKKDMSKEDRLLFKTYFER